MPEGKPGDKLTFKALQTYDDGEIVRWIGPEDADEPAPTVTLAGRRGWRAWRARRRRRRDAVAARRELRGRTSGGSDGLASPR